MEDPYAVSNSAAGASRSINRKSYPAYKSLKGVYQFQKYILAIDHVQGDPFASPSHVSVKISHKAAGFPAAYYKDHLTRITLADYLTRQFEQQVNRYTFRAKGSGKSGLISVTKCGQEVLERTACEITERESLPDFSWDSRRMDEPSIQVNWRRFSLSFSLFVWKKHSSTGI